MQVIPAGPQYDQNCSRNDMSVPLRVIRCTSGCLCNERIPHPNLKTQRCKAYAKYPSGNLNGSERKITGSITINHDSQVDRVILKMFELRRSLRLCHGYVMNPFTHPPGTGTMQGQGPQKRGLRRISCRPRHKQIIIT